MSYLSLAHTRSSKTKIRPRSNRVVSCEYERHELNPKARDKMNKDMDDKYKYSTRVPTKTYIQSCLLLNHLSFDEWSYNKCIVWKLTHVGVFFIVFIWASLVFYLGFRLLWDLTVSSLGFLKISKNIGWYFLKMTVETWKFLSRSSIFFLNSPEAFDMSSHFFILLKNWIRLEWTQNSHSYKSAGKRKTSSTDLTWDSNFKNDYLPKFCRPQ